MKSIISSQVISDQDCRFFNLVDTSIYNPDLEITNPIYRIVLPNFDKYVEIPYSPNTVTVINSNLLKLTTEPGCIPDGLYTITQSICPNDKLYKEFNYFHICTALTNLGNVLCACIKDKEKVEKVWELRMGLEDVKQLAQCGEIAKAKILYNVISERISIEIKSCNCGMRM